MFYRAKRWNRVVNSLNFVKSLDKLTPVVLQWIGVLKLFPWAGAVRAVDNWQVAEEVVLQPHIK